ncbi:3-oxoacyl-[acyl-carrier-protein] reductase FabG-like [Chironomus tepperi]|uniref:3-oxoacyl-[acyl-carrier-protein] reductase FabG-like n=1 Tax=Chironomus tepperi TaxID=113505 RepID=UPI00391FA4D8
MFSEILLAAQISFPFMFILMNKYKSKIPNLRGKNVLVTNGSNGLGQKICISLAQYGCNIIIVDILPADDTLNKLQRYNVKANSFKVDMSNQQEVSKLKTDVINEFGTVDILINNGTTVTYETVFKNSSENVDKMLDGNVCAVENMTNCFVETMKENGCGYIMTISGTPGMDAHPYSTDNSHVKFRIMNFMTDLKEALKRQKFNGIKIVYFSPKTAPFEPDVTHFMKAEEYIKMIKLEADSDSFWSSLKMQYVEVA